MLHDLLDDKGVFAAQRSALGLETRVLAIDARGHGASATLANQWFTIAELAHDVLAVLNLEEITAAHLVGHGLGGAVAFELARQHADRALSLTLIEPSLFSMLDNDPHDSMATRLRDDLRKNDRAAADLSYKGLTDRAVETYLAPRWGTEWRETLPKPRVAAIRRHASALSGILPAVDSYVVPKNELRQFLVPTLLVTGADAHPVARLTSERLALHLPVGRIEQIAFGQRSSGPFSGAGADSLNRVLISAFFDR
jgi:pimeloyl-ACP methyl ester carboxylesterase